MPSAGLTAAILPEGNTYYVVLTQKADLPDHPTVLPSLTNAAMDQAQQTTGALLDRLATARTNAAPPHEIFQNLNQAGPRAGTPQPPRPANPR